MIALIRDDARVLPSCAEGGGVGGGGTGDLKPIHISYGFQFHAPDRQNSERLPAEKSPVFGGGFLIDPDFDDVSDLADLLDDLEDGR